MYTRIARNTYYTPKKKRDFNVDHGELLNPATKEVKSDRKVNYASLSHSGGKESATVLFNETPSIKSEQKRGISDDLDKVLSDALRLALDGLDDASKAELKVNVDALIVAATEKGLTIRIITEEEGLDDGRFNHTLGEGAPVVCAYLWKTLKGKLAENGMVVLGHVERAGAEAGAKSGGDAEYMMSPKVDMPMGKGGLVQELVARKNYCLKEIVMPSKNALMKVAGRQLDIEDEIRKAWEEMDITNAAIEQAEETLASLKAEKWGFMERVEDLERQKKLIDAEYNDKHEKMLANEIILSQIEGRLKMVYEGTSAPVCLFRSVNGIFSAKDVPSTWGEQRDLTMSLMICRFNECEHFLKLRQTPDFIAKYGENFSFHHYTNKSPKWTKELLECCLEV